jgi:hypothetical protein
MAKTRPPKKILESYTIKGSDKVIKREALPLSSAQLPPSIPSSLDAFLVLIAVWIFGRAKQGIGRLVSVSAS